MGLEQRGNNYYLYKKRRVGKRVVSEYYGGGRMAHLLQLLEQADSENAADEKESKRLTIHAEKSKHAEIDQLIEAFGREARAFEDALYLVNGYHTHERQWRKIRNGSETKTE
jgi:hypothetical protein